jgi:RimJ/RimL family protein N-acetyltransferase
MKYFRKLIGEKCYLSPVSLDDVEKYTEWINDMETGQFVLFASGVYDIDKERATLDYLMKHSIIFAIIDKDTNKVIGNCGIHNKSDVHRTGTFGIFIGDKSCWSQGYGTEATMLILDYAFNVLNFNNINLDVVEFNKRGIKCYEKCGFQYVGKRRQAIFMAGKYHDVLTYDILAAEFASPYIKKLFSKTTEASADANKITIV